MASSTFFCIDAHTAGNPVRLVAGGGPVLKGNNMSEKRQDFLLNHDWIRTGLMYEPRGHSQMSGSILYPPSDPENDTGILFIETSGCLPMCGHGTIGTVTMMIEKGLVRPKHPGVVNLEVPGGLVKAEYKTEGSKVVSVRIYNVASYLDRENITIDVPDLGKIKFDVAYGGNFYAIIDPQDNYPGLGKFTASDILRFSPVIRRIINSNYEFIHPLDETIRGLSHVMWTGETLTPGSSGRGAVFYGFNAIDRSPCGTGTSARMAQLFEKNKLKQGEDFIHESIIGSTFNGRVEEITTVGNFRAVIPSFEGWSKITGYNTIIIDEEDDPFAYGFKVV